MLMPLAPKEVFGEAKAALGLCLQLGNSCRGDVGQLEDFSDLSAQASIASDLPRHLIAADHT